ncbi:MAG: PHB depolymerase family esterase, partial [Paracoccaceae bacterium]
MRRFLLILLMMLPLPAVAQDLAEIALPGGRSYLFARPAGREPAPVIIALHGGGGSPRQFARNSGLVRAATGAGFAIALPAGTGRLATWNAGYCCGAAERQAVDDLAFLDAVARDALTRAGGGAKVFVTGMSNGAMMAQTWAAQRPGLVAAVASVSGTMDAAHIRVAGRVPILHIHGTADPMVPFDGGPGQGMATGRIDLAPVAEVLADFRAPFGPLAGRHDTLPGGVERTRWTSGGKVAVELLVLPGGGHEWP